MSVLELEDIPLELIKRKIDGLKDFLKISLSISNAHTVDFYTCNVWEEFIAVPPETVLSIISSNCDQRQEPKNHKTLNCGIPAGKDRTSFGFCDDSKRLVDVAALLNAANQHTLPGLGVSVPLPKLMQRLQEHQGVQPTAKDVPLEPEEFMNSKKSHEVQIMSEVVAALAQRCHVRQVIDVGSGKGYLCSFLSLQYGLQVYGIDSSSSNTHGAQERNRKLQKYSRAYQRHRKERPAICGGEDGARDPLRRERDPAEQRGERTERLEHKESDQDTEVPTLPLEATVAVATEDDLPAGDASDRLSPGVGGIGSDPESPSPFLGVLSPELVELPPPRVPPALLSPEERERRKRENLERKGRGRGSGNILFSPLTSYVTAQTELRDIITHLEDAMLVGLHTCGDLASSSLRMFTARPELKAVCSVGCCYHLLSEEFDPSGAECPGSQWGFPMSQHLRDRGWFCGRNARMSACLALERVSAGGGLPIESLFYRAVLHVILRDHYAAFKSEKRVGNVYSKSASFVDYVRRALRKLGLDDSKMSDSLIQGYHEKYNPRRPEMQAFNMLKVSLAPCIEALILLDRLCYLKEQAIASFSAVVQLFDPLTSPRCYGIVAMKDQSL